MVLVAPSGIERGGHAVVEVGQGVGVPVFECVAGLGKSGAASLGGDDKLGRGPRRSQPNTEAGLSHKPSQRAIRGEVTRLRSASGDVSQPAFAGQVASQRAALACALDVKASRSTKG